MRGGHAVTAGTPLQVSIGALEIVCIISNISHAAESSVTFIHTSRRGRPMAADLTNFEIKNNYVILLLVWFHKMSAGWRPFSTSFDS